MEITSLISDVSSATASTVSAEAHARLLSQHKGGLDPDQTSLSQAANWVQWIARAPISIKMRLFCLPYAGGVSENVFGRYAALLKGQLTISYTARGTL